MKSVYRVGMELSCSARIMWLELWELGSLIITHLLRLAAMGASESAGLGDRTPLSPDPDATRFDTHGHRPRLISSLQVAAASYVGEVNRYRL